jgi:hypothetical protein
MYALREPRWRAPAIAALAVVLGLRKPPFADATARALAESGSGHRAAPAGVELGSRVTG